MKNEKKYLALLQNNTSDNNLLAFELLQSQLNWTPQKALTWIVTNIVQKYQITSIQKSIYLGTIGLVFRIVIHAPIIQFGDGCPILEYVLMNNRLEVLRIDTKQYIIQEAYLIKNIDVKSYQNSVLTYLHLIMPELTKQFVIN